MVPVDLITGFLGAGKTTFLRRYADYLKRKGLRFVIIENEFGRANLDAAFLRDTEDADCRIEQLTGACICCGGEQKFINLLYPFSHCGFDRILVEPSGIYDADTFFRVLESDPVQNWCSIGNVITVLDVMQNPAALSDETQYLMLTQLAAAGTILLSKTQLVPPEQITQTLDAIASLGERFGCPECSGQIAAKDWSALTDADYEMMFRSGSHTARYQRMQTDHDALYDAVTVSAFCQDEAALRAQIRTLLDNPAVFRVKGYVRCADGGVLQCNCTRSVTEIHLAERDQCVLTVIGSVLDEAEIKSRFQA